MRASLALSFIALPFVAHAQDAPIDMATVARVIDHACIELTDDLIGCEEVLLIANPDDGSADLLIGPNVNDGSGAPYQVWPGIVFHGGMFGQRPSLVEGPEGTFKLLSEQTGIGRSPWEQTLSIALRDGEYVLAGITYSTWDRITAKSFTCDVNLRTGGYVITDSDGADNRGKGDRQHITLSDWGAYSSLPEPCGSALSAWWPE